MTRTRRLKTHCIRGHERTPDNIAKSNDGCVVCSRERKRRARAAAKPRPEREQIREANNIAGLNHYIQRRRQRGIPREGAKAA